MIHYCLDVATIVHRGHDVTLWNVFDTAMAENVIRSIPVLLSRRKTVFYVRSRESTRLGPRLLVLPTKGRFDMFKGPSLTLITRPLVGSVNSRNIRIVPSAESLLCENRL